jgi:hypothetical protein
MQPSQRTLAPTLSPERIGMLVPGPSEQPAMATAQDHLRKAYQLLATVRNAITGQPIQDSPAQVALRATVAAIEFAGSSLTDSMEGARQWAE